MASQRTIVGIDPSVSKTGLVIRDRNGAYHATLIDTRAKRGQPKPTDPGRLVSICDRSLAQIEQYGNASPDNPLLLVIEDCVATQGPSRVNIALHWMLRTWVADNMASEVLLVAPATLKKFCTGAGNAEKGTIGAAIMKRWGSCVPDGTTEDVLEALALVKMGECWLSRGLDRPSGELWPAFQREVAWYARAAPAKGEPLPREVLSDSESLRAGVKGEQAA
jgi:Holliday junction resolvasome RuvABC endonuclease subunit